jgi:hypothetical protein
VLKTTRRPEIASSKPKAPGAFAPHIGMERLARIRTGAPGAWASARLSARAKADAKHPARDCKLCWGQSWQPQSHCRIVRHLMRHMRHPVSGVRRIINCSRPQKTGGRRLCCTAGSRTPAESGDAASSGCCLSRRNCRGGVRARGHGVRGPDTLERMVMTG